MTKFPNYPRVSRRNFKRWNEEMFLKYNNERIYNHPNRLIRYIERKRVRAILKYLGLVRKSDHILAAGCGEGYIEKQIEGGKMALVDISRNAIDRAKITIGSKGNREYFIANLEKLPFKTRFFDKIECSEVIEHVYNPKKLLRELNRVAKDNGALVISFPNEPLINKLKMVLLRMRIFNLFFPNIPTNMLEEWHLRAMDLQTFKSLAAEHWSITSVEPVPSVFLPVRYVVLCSKRS